MHIHAAFFFAFSCILFWSVFCLLEYVFVHIFIEGVICLVVELWNTAFLLYNTSCGLTNWSKMEWANERSIWKEREATMCRAVLVLCVSNFCKKGHQLTNFQSWLSNCTAPLVMQTSEIIGSPFILYSHKRTEIGKTCQNQYIEAR